MAFLRSLRSLRKGGLVGVLALLGERAWISGLSILFLLFYYLQPFDQNTSKGQKQSQSYIDGSFHLQALSFPYHQYPWLVDSLACWTRQSSDTRRKSQVSAAQLFHRPQDVSRLAQKRKRRHQRSYQHQLQQHRATEDSAPDLQKTMNSAWQSKNLAISYASRRSCQIRLCPCRTMELLFESQQIQIASLQRYCKCDKSPPPFPHSIQIPMMEGERCAMHKQLNKVQKLTTRYIIQVEHISEGTSMFRFIIIHFISPLMGRLESWQRAFCRKCRYNFQRNYSGLYNLYVDWKSIASTEPQFSRTPYMTSFPGFQDSKKEASAFPSPLGETVVKGTVVTAPIRLAVQEMFSMAQGKQGEQLVDNE